MLTALVLLAVGVLVVSTMDYGCLRALRRRNWKESAYSYPNCSCTGSKCVPCEAGRHHECTWVGGCHKGFLTRPAPKPSDRTTAVWKGKRNGGWRTLPEQE
jgi:hypothetical protein